MPKSLKANSYFARARRRARASNTFLRRARRPHLMTMENSYQIAFDFATGAGAERGRGRAGAGEVWIGLYIFSRIEQ